MHAYANEYDTYVAENALDLEDLWSEIFGDKPFDIDDFAELDPETNLRLVYDAPDDIPSQAQVEFEGGKYYVTMRIWQWIGLNGRGLLCSTEE